MKPYFTIWTWGIALVQGTLVGEAGTAVVEQRTQSFTIMSNGSVSDVPPLFGPVREAEVGAGLVAAFHSTGPGRTA